MLKPRTTAGLKMAPTLPAPRRGAAEVGRTGPHRRNGVEWGNITKSPKMAISMGKLVGKGAERRLVVLRGLACTFQCNCACSLAHLFFHFPKTTSTMEQFQRNMNMNVNIPPHPTTPPHKLHQNKGLTTLKVTSHKFLLARQT